MTGLIKEAAEVMWKANGIDNNKKRSLQLLRKKKNIGSKTKIKKKKIKNQFLIHKRMKKEKKRLLWEK